MLYHLTVYFDCDLHTLYNSTLVSYDMTISTYLTLSWPFSNNMPVLNEDLHDMLKECIPATSHGEANSLEELVSPPCSLCTLYAHICLLEAN